MSIEVLTMGRGGGKSASIFVTGLSETDVVTASKDGKTVGGKLAQVKNPAVVVPDGYTQLEYIEGTGTQYINTGVSCDSDTYEFNVKFKKDNATAGGNLMCASTNDAQWSVGSYFRTANTIDLAVGNSSTHYSYSIVQGNTYEYSVFVDRVNHTWKVFVNGTQVSSGTFTGNVTTNPVYLLSHNNSGTVWQTCPATVYSFTAKKNGVLVRDFIPAKRGSDGVVGLYDLVNGVFYTNAGSGTFNAGAEIPSTVDSFEIAPIKKYGMWTVAATNGERTETQDVLVDAAIEFTTSMSLSA